MPRGPKGEKRPADVIPVKAAWLALSLRALGALGKGQKSESASGEARGGRGLGALMGNAPQDTRDAETIMASVESEFRRACEAQTNFLDWRKKSHEATFALVSPVSWITSTRRCGAN